MDGVAAIGPSGQTQQHLSPKISFRGKWKLALMSANVLVEVSPALCPWPWSVHCLMRWLKFSDHRAHVAFWS
eukprot:1534662-Amphidinium_carterae.1